MGCNKVAYAHHKDDIIETMLLSLIFEGRFHSFSPKTYLDRMDLTVIRPLMFVDEMDVIGFRNKYDLPVRKEQVPGGRLHKTPVCKGSAPTAQSGSSGREGAHVPRNPERKYIRLARAVHPTERKRLGRH